MADYGGDHRRGGVGAIGDASAGPGLHDRRVYIGQLPFAIDSVDKLAELLYDRGIKDHDVLKVPVSPEDGRARGFAFASFTTVAAATKCIELLDQSNVDGRIVTCTRSYKQDAPMRTGPGQGGYMPPAMEVTGVNKGESQWEVLARIQARYGVAMPAAEPTAAAPMTHHHHPTIENGGVIPPPPPPGAPQTILPKISSLAAVVGRDAARRATGRDAGTMNAPASNDDDDDGTVPPPPPPGGPPIPSQTGFLATDDDDGTPPPPPPPGGPPAYTTGLTQPRVARVPSRRPGVDAGPSLVKLEKAGKRERMRKLRASGVFLMGDASEDDDKDDDTDDRAAAAAPHAAAPHAKRARVLEEVHAVTGEARPEDLVRYESYKPAELAPSKIDEIRARAAAAAARAAAKSAGMF